MNRAKALAITAILLNLYTQVAPTSAKYVLHVVADDLGYDDVGWYPIIRHLTCACRCLHAIYPSSA